jgi:archaemetzincin
MDIKDFYRQERKQYDAQAIISAYEKIDSTKRTILLTNLDLFIPIFTFVFGLAKLNGHVGIVSTYRLRTEFYGLPSDPILLKMRLSKEILHEFGHLQNLRHCPDYRCVMASSNTADDLDIKSNHFCNSCLKKMPLV